MNLNRCEQETHVKIPSQIFGKTRSSKDICTYSSEDPALVASLVNDFSPSDSFDAMALFQYLLIRARRRVGEDSDDFRRMALHELCHSQRLTHQELELEMRVLLLVTSIDMVQYGKGRAHHFFID